MESRSTPSRIRIAPGSASVERRASAAAPSVLNIEGCDSVAAAFGEEDEDAAENAEASEAVRAFHFSALGQVVCEGNWGGRTEVAAGAERFRCC